MKILPVLSVLALTLCVMPACDSNSKDANGEKVQADGAPADAAAMAAAAAKEAEAKAAAEVAEKKKVEQERITRNTSRLEKFTAAADAESARWTPKTHKAAKRLAKKSYRNLKAGLKATTKGSHRTPGNSDRDQYRHPMATMKFFGVKPNSKIVEFGAGSGWYTELLAPMVAKKGAYTVTSADPEGSMSSGGTIYAKRLQLFLKKSPELFGHVKVSVLADGDSQIGEPGSADIVLAIREMHNWHRGGKMEGNLKSAFNVLSSGGVLAVVQHRAKDDANADESAKQGRLPEKFVIEKAKAAGFTLDKSSDVNANSNDTKDYKEGVWTLPPSLALKDQDREKYIAIGESDRMTLRFVKP